MHSCQTCHLYGGSRNNLAKIFPINTSGNFACEPIRQGEKAAGEKKLSVQFCEVAGQEWKRSERATSRTPWMKDGGDLQEADHKRVSCVGLFPLDGGKDRYYLDNTCVIA